MKRKMDWKQLAPEGVSAKREALFTGLALLASALWSLTAPGRIHADFEAAARGQIASLTGFETLLGPSLYGFYLVAAAMVLLAVWHYAKMKGYKPTPGENIHLRAMAVPALGVVLALCLSLILYFAYRGLFSGFRGRLNELARRAWQASGGA